jgi:hypothetical protein
LEPIQKKSLKNQKMIENIVAIRPKISPKNNNLMTSKNFSERFGEFEESFIAAQKFQIE